MSSLGTIFTGGRKHSARLRQSFGEAISLPMRASHVAHLDGWRGLCILLVLIGHFVPGMHAIANVGVEFFFVLSGRLMAEILIFKRQPIPLFIKRRMSRVVPALAVYVLLAGVTVNLAIVVGGGPLHIASPIAALLFFHNYLPESQVFAALDHTWSLAVEEHSYLLLVVIAFLSGRRPRLAILLALAICLAAFVNSLRLAAAPPPDAQSIFFLSEIRVASVLLSFAMCIAVRRADLRNLPPAAQLVSPVAALLSILCLVSGPMDPIRLAACTVLAAVAVNGLEVSAASFRKLLEHPLAVWLGTLSFSLYLWQQTFFVAHVKGGMPSAVALVLAVGCAIWSVKRVEMPARDYLNARWARTAALPHGGLAPQQAS